MRLLSDVTESPLFNQVVPVDELRSRIRQIRSGFEPAPHGADVAGAYAMHLPPMS
jgi:hypothetical protein